MKKATISLRLRPELKRMFVRLARTKDITLSALVVQELKKLL